MYAFHSKTIAYNPHETVEYWKEVKSEIEKL